MAGGSGPGGGVVGAVLLSPFIAPGTTSSTAYNHYSMLGSVEDLFGLPRLAGATGTVGFGSDVYTKPNGPGGGPPTTTTTTTTVTPPVAPQDSGLQLKPASFAPQSQGKARKHHGTTISYSDSQAAVTKLTIERLAPGYRLGHHACKALKPAHQPPKHSHTCTITNTVGSLTHQDTTGPNSLAFTGRLHRHSLATGSYLLQATPTLGGLTGTTRSANFQIV
jgi:hypothetical protein